MSGWCAGCHTAYGYDGGANSNLNDAGDWTSDYNAADGLGFTTRHRHPINVEMSNFDNPASPVLLDSGLPLAHAAADKGSNDTSDWIDCMTCHNAHGTTAVMDAGSYADPNGSWEIGEANLTMVAPDSALLKMDNRGVCEACHNK
jgi:mono/diheme cytochrome c family protein